MMIPELFAALPFALKRRYLEFVLKQAGMTRAQIRATLKELKNSTKD